MAQSKNTPRKPRKPSAWDCEVVDEPVTYTDMRTRPDTNEFWEGHIVEINGEKYIKPETANRIICENHDLRETLFMQESEFEQRAFDRFKQCTQHSTTKLKNMIRSTSKISFGLSEKDVYNLTYSYMAKVHGVDFQECPQDKSKINWLWENGWLPTMYLAVWTIRTLCGHFKSHAQSEYASMEQALKKKMQKNGQHKRHPGAPKFPRAIPF